MFKEKQLVGIIGVLYAAAVYAAVLYIYGRYEVFGLDNLSWTIGDWLINYSDGFIRRGLVGTLLLWSSNALGANIVSVINVFQLAIYACIILLTLNLFLTTQRSVVTLCLVFSPLYAIIFSMVDIIGFFRKEILVFTLYLGMWTIGEHIHKKQHLSMASDAIFLALFICCLFSHELTFFTLPFFLFYYYTQKNRGFVSNRYFINISMVWVGCAVVSLLSLLFFGSDKDVVYTMTSRLIASGIHPEMTKGSILALTSSLQEGLGNVVTQITRHNYLSTHGVAMLLGLLPFQFVRFNKQSRFTLFAILAFLCLLPLFVVALDWGRWLLVYITLLTIATLALLKRNEAHLVALGSSLPAKTAYYLLAVVYMLSWSVHHSSVDMLKSGMLIIPFHVL